MILKGSTMDMCSFHAKVSVKWIKEAKNHRLAGDINLAVTALNLASAIRKTAFTYYRLNGLGFR